MILTDGDIIKEYMIPRELRLIFPILRIMLKILAVRIIYVDGERLVKLEFTEGKLSENIFVFLIFEHLYE